MNPTELPHPLLAEALELRPHPEGGWFRETWRAATRFEPDGYDGIRATATAIYFLLEPGQESRWHRVRSEELWIWQRGGPLLLDLGGRGAEPNAQPQTITLGEDFATGQQLQALVPAGCWQSARTAANDAALATCVVSPGFEFDDFELR
jgi:uncharacterized protein